MTEWLFPLLAGFGTGILSAWGVGGGTLLLVIMTLFLGVDPVQARCINLLYFLPTAAMALPQYKKQGLLSPSLLRAAVPAGLLAAGIGSVAALWLDVDALRRPFGVFLLATGVYTLLKREPQKSSGE